MNFKDLLSKLEELSEATDDARAQYDQFKADDERKSAIEQIKKIMSPGGKDVARLGNAVDPSTGVLYYGADQGMAGVKPQMFPFKWFQANGPAETQQFGQLLKSAGLEVVPHEVKGLFGNVNVYAKVDPQKLATIDTPVPTPTPAPSPDTKQDAKPSEFSMDWRPKLDRLRELLNQLEKGRGQGPNPAPVPPKPKASNVQPRFVGQGPGDSTLKGAPKKSQELIRKSYDDSTSAGGAMGESIAKELVESFGYELDEVSDELAAGGAAYAAANPLEKKLAGQAANTAAKSFAGKAAQKLLPGVATAFGTADAIHRYKQGDYLGAGIAGTSAALALIPGVGWIPSLALDAFNIGRDMGATTKAAPEVAQKYPPKGDTPIKQLQRVIGTKDDGIFGPKSQEALKAWQQSKGLKVTGQPTPDVIKAAGVALSEQFTRTKSAAELIAETQSKLEQLENPLPTFYLCEDGTIIAVDADENVYALMEKGLIGTGADIAADTLKAGMPKAGSDFSKYAPGWERIFGKGADTTTGAATAAKPNYAGTQMTATPKGAPAGVTPPGAGMPKPPAKAPAKKPTPPNYGKGQMTAKPANAPAGVTPPGAGIPKGVSVGKLGAAEEKGIAALTKAEQTALKAEVNAMKPATKQSWVQRYPRLSKALGIAGVAAVATGLGYLAGKDTQDPNPTPGPGPKPTPTPGPAPAIDSNDPRLAEINQLFSELAFAENPDVQKELQGYRQQFGTIMKDPNIGSLGGKGAAAGSATDAADNYQIPAN